MKTSKLSLSIAVFALSLAVAITSCKKKETTPPADDNDTSVANDNAQAQKASDDASNMAAQASEDGSMSSYRNGDETTFATCATVVRDTVLRKITVTFNGQSCLDGHTRSGTLTFDYSGSPAGVKYYRNPGYKVVVSSSGYVVDGEAVTINHTVINTSTLSTPQTNLTWSLSSSVSIVKSAGTVSWSKTGVRTLLNTSDSSVYHGQAVHITWSKAIVGLTGSESGQGANGNQFTVTITNQLKRDFNCSPNQTHPGHHPFIDGTLDFTPGTKATRHVDYAYPNSVGSGACDDKASVTINNKVYYITLP